MNTRRLILMLLVMLASVMGMQAEIVHHTVCKPTYSSRGFTRECWENTETGAFYSDAACKQELKDSVLAQTVIYAKLPECPVSDVGTSMYFHVNEFDEAFGVSLNWAAETYFYNASEKDRVLRSALFLVENDGVDNARMVWTKDQGDKRQGTFTVTILVNHEEVFTLTQDSFLEGAFVVRLPGLKREDQIQFTVLQDMEAEWADASPTFKASLEYTFAVHHEVCEPTSTTRGFTSECWENTGTGAIYADADCTQELTDADLAKTVIYTKLLDSPVTEKTDNFTVVETDKLDAYDVTLNWAAETTYDKASTLSSDPRYAKFAVAEDGVNYARLVWTKDQGDVKYGKYSVKILVNDSVAFSLKQDSSLEGVFVQRLPGLKTGDVVTFQVTQDQAATDNTAKPTFKASLEHTFYESKGIYHAVCDPTLSTRGFTSECWEIAETGQYYSDMECTKELTGADLAKTVVYCKLPKSPIKSVDGFVESDHTERDWEVDLNWAAVATIDQDESQSPRTATFQIANVTPSYARLVWNRDKMSENYGRYTVSIYVNGEQIFTRNQDENYQGVFVQPLPGVKAGDEITFEVKQYAAASYSTRPTFKASLEYAFDCDHTYPEGSAICSNCGYITPHEHHYVDHVCTLCNALEPGVLLGYVGKDADRKNVQWLLDIDGHTLTFTGSGEMEDFVPEHCGWIDDQYISNITKVIIGEGITSIGNSQRSSHINGYFSNMSGLNEVSLPSTLQTLGSCAFYGCEGLKQIIFPDGLLTIGDAAFNSSALEEISIPTSVTSIGGTGFAFTNLKKVTVKGSSYLGDGAFYHCQSLTDFYLMGSSPVPTDSHAFDETDLSGATLHVNNAIIDWAKITDPWNGFGTIKPFGNISVVDDNDVLQIINFNPEATDNVWTLSDGGKKIAVYEDIPMLMLTYTRNFPVASQWQALYVPFELQFSDWATNFDVAAIRNFHEYSNEKGETEKVELEVRIVKSGKLRPNTPYLIRAKAAGQQSIVLDDVVLKTTEKDSIDCCSTERKYTFIGTYDAIDELKTKDYIFVSGGQLCKANDDTDLLDPMRWYLTIEDRESMTSDPSPLLSKPINIRVVGESSGVTGIEEVTVVSSPAEAAADGIYTLSGMRLTKPQRGVNIVNSKKIIVK